jgi:hypothetical protein
LLAAYGVNVHRGTIFVVELMVGVAALSVGILLGFLFGMPRGQAATAGQKTNGKEGGAPRHAQGPGYEPSTNLEQVSDWLTKILVGIGLVEFGKLRDALASAGDLAARSLDPPVAGASVVSQLVMIAFTVIGFLASFLWTRVYYGVIQFSADKNIWSLLNELNSRVSESSAESQQAVSLASLLAAGKLTQPNSAVGPDVALPAAIERPAQESRLPGEILAKISQFQNALAEFDSNPTGDLFGRAPKATKGRQLVGWIAMTLPQALILTVRVEATASGPPLTGDAIFLLHPTIPNSVRRVACKNDSAEVQFYSEGWFHVAAIVDDGQTVVALDLRQIPDVPQWFKEM